MQFVWIAQSNAKHSRHSRAWQATVSWTIDEPKNLTNSLQRLVSTAAPAKVAVILVNLVVKIGAAA